MPQSQAQKRITSDTGGKLGPARGLPDGREDRTRLPKIIEARTEELPTEGLVVSPPRMAKAIADGEKTLLVKSRPFDIAKQRYLLISLRKAVAVVELGGREEITDEQFAEREAEHLITKETRAEWCEAQPSWCEGPLWAWPVKVVEKFDEPRGTNVPVGPQVVAHDVRVEETQKIEDVEDYDPAEADDDQLRDDFRILLAWYAGWKKDPDGFEHDLETIETLLRKVIKELVARGPDVIQFNPKGMKASVRQFFERVARDVKVPEEMYKALELAPDTDPDDLTAKELVAAHWRLHKLFDQEAGPGRGAEGWSTEDIVNLHARVVDKMGEHPPPPDNGLDELSEDFEEGAADRPKWHEEPAAKRDLSTINRSGEVRGDAIAMADVLPHFKDFKIRKPFIYLVGGLANHGETQGDIDVLVNVEEDTPDWMKQVVEFRLGRALPSDLAERLDVHFDRERGPFTNFVELYDLRAERVNLENEVKEMRDADKAEDPPNLLRSIAELATFARGRADA